MHQLRRNLLVLASCACAAGMALGTPLSWLIWSLFRLTLADTPEMVLIFDFRAYGIPLVFTGFVLAALSVMLSRFLGRIHVLDIITESHRAEPVHAVPRWFGLLGILLIVTGGLLGYFTPVFCVRILHWYPPESLTAIFYLPALAGLYLLLLHTVVNGWHRGRSRYTHLVSTSMMQFQGQQTVRNMLVVTVLTAGALFSAFYVPMMVTPAQLWIQNRPADYSFFYRADQNLPDQSEIEQLAHQHGVTVTDFVSQPTASLAIDGFEEVETKKSCRHHLYRRIPGMSVRMPVPLRAFMEHTDRRQSGSRPRHCDRSVRQRGKHRQHDLQRGHPGHQSGHRKVSFGSPGRSRCSGTICCSDAVSWTTAIMLR